MHECARHPSMFSHRGFDARASIASSLNATKHSACSCEAMIRITNYMVGCVGEDTSMESSCSSKECWLDCFSNSDSLDLATSGPDASTSTSSSSCFFTEGGKFSDTPAVTAPVKSSP